MRNNYILIDYENTQVQNLDLIDGEGFFLIVFLGPNNTKLHTELVLRMQKLGSRAEYVTLETPGHNALDFHIAYYLGKLAQKDPSANFYVISKDAGFDPLVRFLKTNKLSCTRSTLIENIPCFQNKKKEEKSQKLITAIDNTIQKYQTVDEGLNALVERLTKNIITQPKTTKSLKNCIQSLLGRSAPIEMVEQVYNSLLKNKYAVVIDENISYKLPAQ